MNMLIEELQRLSTNPFAWLIIALLGLAALYAVVTVFRCPLLHDKAQFAPEDIVTAKKAPKTLGPRFALVMLFGFSLTVSGLLMIADGLHPTIALAAMVVGITIVQTEPQRLQIADARRQLVAALDMGESALDDARKRLRSNYQGLAAIYVVLLFGVTGGLLAF